MAIIDESKLPKAPTPVYVSPVLSYHSQLNSITPDTPEREIYDLLSAAYTHILSDDYVKRQPQIIRQLFTQDKVLRMMGKVMKNAADSNKITHDQRVRMNKIIYSMIKNNTASEYQQSLLMDISRNTNRIAVQKLCYCVPEQMACMLGMLRYSSMKEGTNVLRVNDYLLKTMVPNDNTEQTIVRIYDALFQRVTFLFEGIMLDVKDKGLMTDNEKEIYGIQNLAVLDIIENMPNNYIYQVLSCYYDDMRLVYTGMPTRFALTSISLSDYPRICAVDQQIDISRAGYMA
jgi:hypothetical protein